MKTVQGNQGEQDEVRPSDNVGHSSADVAMFICAVGHNGLDTIIHFFLCIIDLLAFFHLISRP